MFWCGLWKDRIIGPFYFDSTVNSGMYLAILGVEMLPDLDLKGLGKPDWFMQDGAPPHFGTPVRSSLDENFP